MNIARMSHGQCTYEDLYDEEEIRNLPDGTIRITADWKHKILECYHRENMLKYVGKKGSSMLGFMLMWNLTDPIEKAKGIKEVRYIMMLTDDGLQNEWAVICAKLEIYENHVPSHITNSIFVADGVSYFSSKIHRAIQWLWESWTGINERELGITVAGGGKSSLDGTAINKLLLICDFNCDIIMYCGNMHDSSHNYCHRQVAIGNVTAVTPIRTSRCGDEVGPTRAQDTGWPGKHDNIHIHINNNIRKNKNTNRKS